jgi:hypothetical protein
MLSGFALLGLVGVPLVILIIVGLAILAFEITMFVSVILNRVISGSTKALWIIGMLLIHPFVAIGYYFTDYKKTK